jgi:hypothetical protein
VVSAVPVTATDREGMHARLAPSRHQGLATGDKIALEGSLVNHSGRTESSPSAGAGKQKGKLQTIRYIAVLITGFFAGSRAVDAIRSWREWHSWAARDPSGADAYKTFFMANAIAVALSLAIAVLVWWLLRPRPAR